MNSTKKGLAMGIVICSNCGSSIDALPTQKVTTYYSYCNHPECQKRKNG
ncbi:GapA-binding peptide SR1P [Gracilibacillus salinarum]|uniref:GapA-binding peptide SR1P n=1 Tax=Gracilibacillus salinarum TaxID=2932255 RepID=A0ABY4GK29_9BACI|nr:GapA-binding peptide SR1P [Gracilibacillus salinarum]UOQ84579.1 GapA-binding peptide SR1P [Gracilibacillus salinarum]